MSMSVSSVDVLSDGGREWAECNGGGPRVYDGG